MTTEYLGLVVHFLVRNKTCKQKEAIICLFLLFHNFFVNLSLEKLAQKPIFLFTVYDALYKNGVDCENLLRLSPEKKDFGDVTGNKREKDLLMMMEGTLYRVYCTAHYTERFFFYYMRLARVIFTSVKQHLLCV